MYRSVFPEIVVVLVCILLAGCIISYKNDKIRDLKQSEKEFKEKYIKLQLELESEQRNRTLLRDSIKVFQLGRDSLTQQINQKDKELKSIRGRYNNYKPSELEAEMERRAYGR